MHLRSGEVIEKVVKRHLTPFIMKILGIALIALPIYIFLSALYQSLQDEWLLWLLAGLSVFIGMIITVIALDYLLDRLIITNRRLVWVDWKNLFERIEHEAELIDIEDIETHEKGVLSRIRIFDYGLFGVETAASNMIINFKDCPDPEGVKHFVLMQMEKLGSSSGPRMI